MVTGDSMTKAMGVIAEIATLGNKAGVRKARADLVQIAGRNNCLATVATLRTEVNNNIGYMAGMFSVELGNRILEVFEVEHPYFGSQIPDDIGVAFDMGKKLGKEYARKVQTEAEIAKKNAQVAKLGVMLPESDETVTNDDAAKILNALRVAKGGKARLPSVSALPTSGPLLSGTALAAELDDDEDEDDDFHFEPFPDDDEEL